MPWAFLIRYFIILMLHVLNNQIQLFSNDYNETKQIFNRNTARVHERVRSRKSIFAINAHRISEQFQAKE